MSNNPTELMVHMKEFREQTGYGLANVYVAFHKGDYAEARALLNEQMAMNYMADNGSNFGGFCCAAAVPEA